MFRKNKGFTLIELVVVIALLGIMAVVAVPRFLSLTGSGRTSTLNGLAGAIQSAVALAQLEYIQEGYNSGSSATSITMNGTAVTVIAGTGRPAGSAAGIGAALQTVSGFTGTFAAGVATYDFTTAITNCKLTYTDTTGAIAITSSGC